MHISHHMYIAYYVCVGSQITNLLILLALFGYAAHVYIRLRQRVTKVNTLAQRTIKMNVDELLDQLSTDTAYRVCDQPPVQKSDHVTAVQSVIPHQVQCHKRERLAALAAGGQAKQYLGRNCTVDQIDDMADDEIEKLYTRYEARLGAAMTKTLGAAALQLYSTVASKILPIPPENMPKLIADLGADPFVEHALSSATCELYYKYGMYLAPLTTALTTAKYCQFGDPNSCTIHDTISDDDRTTESYRRSDGEGDSDTSVGSASDPSTEGP